VHVASLGGSEVLGNAALRHHHAVSAFCRQRAAGCTWAEHHALVDHSREPWAHLFDAMRIPAEPLPPRPSQCARVHRPSAASLLELVRRSQPAVLTGLVDEWPALRRWKDARYLHAHFGSVALSASISDNGHFDHPEAPEAWGLSANQTLRAVVARPAREPMTMADALSATRPGSREGGDSSLTTYVEYLPLDMLHVDSAAASRMAHDLGVDAATTDAPNEAASSRGIGNQHDEKRPAPVLHARGSAEIAALPVASWLLPRKQLLWMGGGGTVASTHYDPYENLMVVVAGEKTFHLASPESGRQLGAYAPMAEGQLRLDKGARRRAHVGQAAGTLPGWRVVRAPRAVGESSNLTHYAPTSLSARGADERPDVHGATVFSCIARAGDVLYVPAYWFHEVTSALSPDEPTDSADERRVVAVSWFFQSFYDRIFPNYTFDRSPHYLLLDDQQPLEDPFPPHKARTNGARVPSDRSNDPEAGRTADRDRAANRAAPAHGRSGGASKFYARLREKSSQREQEPGFREKAEL
jgi:hypothetical protein